MNISNLDPIFQWIKSFLRQMKVAVTLLIPGGTLSLDRENNKLLFNAVSHIHGHIPVADRTILFV